MTQPGHTGDLTDHCGTQSINQSKALFDIKLYIRIIGVVHVCCNVSGDPR